MRIGIGGSAYRPAPPAGYDTHGIPMATRAQDLDRRRQQPAPTPAAPRPVPERSDAELIKRSIARHRETLKILASR